MTQAYVTPWTSYTADGLTTTFVYPWRIGAATDLTVYVNDLLATAYSVTGVDAAGGGTIVFQTAPPADATVFVRRVTSPTQSTDYLDNDAFGAQTHESALDKVTRLVQDLEERFSRIPMLPLTTGNALRNLTLPAPVANQLLGCNALGTGYQLYDMPGGPIPQPLTIPGFPTPLIDVRASPYFADATGVTPATTALQEVLDVLGSAGGGIAWLGGGVFSLDATLIIPRGVSLIGVGGNFRGPEGAATNVYPTTLRWDGVALGTMVRTADYWNGHLEQLTLDGNNQAHICLHLDRVPRGIYVGGVRCRRTAASGGAGFVYESAEDLPYTASLNCFERLCCREMGSYAAIIRGTTHNTFVNCEFFAEAETALLIESTTWAVSDVGKPDDFQFLGGVVYGGPAAYGLLLNHGAVPEGGFLINFYGTAFGAGAGGTPIYAANNQGYSHFYGCYMYTGGTPPYVLDPGGKLHFHDSFENEGSGRPPGFAITVTASPFTYTNPGPYTLEVNLWGGTVSLVQFGRDGAFGDVGGGPGDGGRSYTLEPSDALRVTYTVLPNMSAAPH